MQLTDSRCFLRCQSLAFFPFSQWGYVIDLGPWTIQHNRNMLMLPGINLAPGIGVIFLLLVHSRNEPTLIPENPSDPASPNNETPPEDDLNILEDVNPTKAIECISWLPVYINKVLCKARNDISQKTEETIKSMIHRLMMAESNFAQSIIELSLLDLWLIMLFMI